MARRLIAGLGICLLWLGLAQATVDLAWDYSASNEALITGFHVWRATNCQPPFVRLTTTPLAPTARTYSDTGVALAATNCWAVISLAAAETHQSRPSTVAATNGTWTNDLTSDLLLHLSFDDGLDPTDDSAPGDHDGDLSATGATFDSSTPQYGARALTLDGTSGVVTVSGLVGADAGSAVTLSAWVKIPSTAPASDAEVVSLGDYAMLRLQRVGDVFVPWFSYYEGGSSWNTGVASTSPLQPATWQHVAVTIRQGVQQLYLNGVMVGTAATNPEAIVWTGQGSNTTIGRHAVTSTNWLTGSVDDVRVYGRALTPPEIAQLFFSSGGPGNNAPTCTVTSPTTLGWWYTSTTTPVTTLAGTVLETDDTAETMTWACPGCPGGSQSGTATLNAARTGWSIASLTLTPDATQTLTLTATETYGATGTCALVLIHQATPNLALPEAWWRLDDGTGATALDATAHGYTGMLSGSASFGAGHIGSGATIMGPATGAITVNGLLGLPTQSPQALTLAGWFRFAAVPHGDAEILSAGDHVLIRASSTTLTAYFYAGSSTWVGLTSPWPPGTPADTAWHHLAYTYTSGAQELSLDGVALAQATDARPIVWTGLGANVVMGRHAVQTTQQLTGALDDLRVYPRVLSAIDLAALVGTPPSTPPTCTVTTPATSPFVVTTSPYTALAGTATDDVTPTSLAWWNGRTLRGGDASTSNGWATWTVPSIPLALGENLVTLTVYDGDEQQGTCSVTLDYQPPTPDAFRRSWPGAAELLGGARK